MLMVLQHLTSGIDPILFAIAVQIAEIKIHSLFIAICNISQLAQDHLAVIGISHSLQIIHWYMYKHHLQCSHGQCSVPVQNEISSP